jgi:hypothetical protein
MTTKTENAAPGWQREAARYLTRADIVSRLAVAGQGGRR